MRSDSSYVSGLTSFLVVRIWFGNAVEDFNRSIQEAGSNGPQLIAATGNGFTSMFFCTPEPKHTISHPCSGLGRLRVLCSFCHQCFDPATRNIRWQNRYGRFSPAGQFRLSPAGQSCLSPAFPPALLTYLPTPRIAHTRAM